MTRNVRFFLNKLHWKYIVFLILLFFLSGCSDSKKVVPKTYDCWPCAMYSIFLNLIDTMAEKFFEKVRELSLDLLAIGLLFYITSFGYKLFAGFLGQAHKDVVKMRATLFKTIFKSVIVAALLSSHEMFLSIIEFVVIPVLQAFIGVSRTILEASDLRIPVYNSSGQTSGLFSQEVGPSIEMLIYLVFQKLNVGMQLGLSALSGNLFQLFIALCIWGLFFWMSLYVPFIFIDSFFRLGFLIVVSPLVLICIPFPVTKKVVKTAWDILFGSMCQLLLGCLFISLMIMVLNDHFFPKNFNGLVVSKQVAQFSFFGTKRQASTLEILLLIWCLFKMMKELPTLSKYFGGDSEKASIDQALGVLKKVMGSAFGLAKAGVQVIAKKGK